MKLTKKDFSSFFSKPAFYRGALLFGPDEGQVRISRKQVIETFGSGAEILSLAPENIASEPQLLFEALSSMSLLGDTSIVVVDGAGDKLTSILKDVLTTPSCQNFLLLCGGDLPARSTLRMLCEKEKSFASLAFYRDEGVDLVRFIEQFLREQNIRADRDCIQYLASQLGNDRGVTQKELEKIHLYLGEHKTLTLEDARLLVGGNDNFSTDELCSAMADGNHATVFALAEKLLAEGESGVALLRTASRYMERLMTAKLAMERGISADAAMEQIKPPVFYKQKPAFRRQLMAISSHALTRILAVLLEGEITIKRGMEQSQACLHSFSLASRLSRMK